MNAMTPIACPSEAPAPTCRSAMLAPSQITEHPDFRFRHMGVDSIHVRQLVQHLRNTGRLDPLTVWQEVDPEGAPTGQHILMDGVHRLAAYMTVRGKPSQRNKPVPVTVFTGSRADALAYATTIACKASLSLTAAERADAAWRMVRQPAAPYSKAYVAGCTGTSPRTVATMRRRWKELTEMGKTAAGEWWKDRQDDARCDTAQEGLTADQEVHLIDTMAEAFQNAAHPWPYKNHRITAAALAKAFGFRHRMMAEHLYGEFDDCVSTDTGTATDPDADF